MKNCSKYSISWICKPQRLLCCWTGPYITYSYVGQEVMMPTARLILLFSWLFSYHFPFNFFPFICLPPFTANLHFSKNADCDVSCSSIGHTFHFLNPVIKTIILLNNRRSSFCVHGSYHTPLHFWWISELRKNRLSNYSKRSKDCNKVAKLCECSFVKIRTLSNNLNVS